MYLRNCKRYWSNAITETHTFPRDALQNTNFYQSRTRNVCRKICKEDSQSNAVAKKMHQKLIGTCENRGPCINLRPLKLGRDNEKSSYLPPNVYDTMKVPYESKQGIGGAYWEKLPSLSADRKKSESKASGSLFKDLKAICKTFKCRSNSQKSILQSNARERRATIRCMITDPILAHRDQSELSPAHYELKNHTISNKISTRKYLVVESPPNPHLFLRRSNVPDTLLSYIPRHQSFQPAVGRYDIRLRNYCCIGKAINKTSSPRKTATDWSHVKGGGFRRLFHVPTSPTQKPLKRSAKKLLEKKQEKQEIAICNHRHAISLRSLKRPPISSKIRFHCIFKRRKFPLQKNVNYKQVERIKSNRRAKSRFGKIFNSDLKDKTTLYKPDFKFLPLPAERILVTKKSILTNDGKYTQSNFYNKTIDVNEYLKKKKDSKKAVEIAENLD